MSEIIECKSSVTLLKECDAGVKMAIKSIDDILSTGHIFPTSHIWEK